MTEAADEPYEVESSDWKKARKPYVCEKCGGAIAVRDVYLYEREPWHTTGTAHRTCAKCVPEEDRP